MKSSNHHSQQGQILLLGLIVLAILIMMSGVILGYVSLQLRAGRQAYARTQVLQLAEAGLDNALYELNLNPGYAGDTTPVALPTGEFTSSVATINPSNKLVTVTGYIPNSNNPTAQVTIRHQITINSTEVAFNYGVQVGPSGMQMANNSRVNGNVFSDGNIIGGNGATITGNATVAGGGAVAPDQQCTDTVSDLDLNNTANRVDLAQQFIPDIGGPLTKLSVYLKKIGNPSDISVYIVTDNGSDNPTTTTVGGSGVVARTAVTGSYGWVDVGFSSAPSLTAGAPYWLVLNTSGTASSYYTLGQSVDAACVDGSGAAYTSNANANNATWTLTNTDINFKTFMGGVDTILDNVNVSGTARAHTLTGCTVGGDAYFHTDNTCTVTGSQFSNSPDEAPLPLPISEAQIAQWESTASTGDTITGPYTVTNETLGPAVIEGDLLVTGTLYLTGPVWVKGDITLDQNSAVRAAALLGNNGAIIFADDPADQAGSGFIDVANNSVIAGNNNPGSYVMILTTKFGSAMNVKNNAAAAVYYASKGTINVANNAGGNQITGYGIALQENAFITYSTGLQHATFANGPGGSWALLKGTYMIED